MLYIYSCFGANCGPYIAGHDAAGLFHIALAYSYMLYVVGLWGLRALDALDNNTMRGGHGGTHSGWRFTFMSATPRRYMDCVCVRPST